MIKKRKILFLGESYRADAITWITGLKEFGDFEIITWELKTPSTSYPKRMIRILEFMGAYFKIKKIIKTQKPDMIVAERTTSYGCLAALSGLHPFAIAQQGITDLWPEQSILLPLKKIMQKYAFKKADLIHAWGPAMTVSMSNNKVNLDKVLVIPKGINLIDFGPENQANSEKICAIVTRSLAIEYRHSTILKSFALLKNKGINFTLTIIGDGPQLSALKSLSKKLGIENDIHFTGRIPNTALPKLLQQSNIYISMPITEGVSASLFEAMACSCYPIVSDIPGNQSWICHGKNGQLIPIDNSKKLYQELMWSFKNKSHRAQAVIKNREFVEKQANYHKNMKIISDTYHQLIKNNSTQ